MRVIIVTAGCLAIGVALAAPPAGAQGPVRQGLRRTGEIAVEGAGAVARGAGAVARGAAEGAGAVARGAVEGAGAVARGTGAVVGGAARGIAAGVDAITPDLPLQARAGATLSAAEQARDARWRFAQHNGEWWYYSPENRWMYHRDGQWNEFAEDTFVPPAGAGQFGGEYSMGYRGVDEGGAVGAEPYAEGGYVQGPVYTLQYDEYGREFICDNGQRVYFDSQGEGQWGDPTPGIPTEAGYRGETPEPATGAPTLDAESAPATGATPPADPAPAAGAAAGAGVTTAPAGAAVGAGVTTPPTGAAAGAGVTAPPAGALDGAIEGDLPAESPRDINQSETTPTEGTIEPSDSTP
jgi:hypothetical protein